MGVYSRFKKSAEGFRQLVELLESTPPSRRQKMITVGMLEDPEYTVKALEYVMTFEDVIGLSEPELAELMATLSPRIVAYAIAFLDKEIQKKFIRCSRTAIADELESCLEAKIGASEAKGAQLRLIVATRELEKKGLVRKKQIPLHVK